MNKNQPELLGESVDYMQSIQHDLIRQIRALELRLAVTNDKINNNFWNRKKKRKGKRNK